MPNSNNEQLEFQCPKCARRLKAGANLAGRRVKCPGCQQPVKVPGPAVAPPAAASAIDEDWLNLGGPAITDLTEREKASEEIKAEKARKRHEQIVRARQRREQESTVDPLGGVEVPKRPTFRAPIQPRKVSEQPSPQPVDQQPDEDFKLAPIGHSRKEPRNSEVAKRSIFDDDLPELEELTAPVKPSRNAEKLLEEHANSPPVKADPPRDIPVVRHTTKTPRPEPSRPRPTASTPPVVSSELKPLYEDGTDPEYRVTCPTCGTPQYIPLSAKGMKLKCPDCLASFKVPPPPPGWTPKKVAVPADNWTEPTTQEMAARQKARTSAMLEKAQQQLSDEELDRLYDHDFDTANFVQRTFGLFKDPIAVAQMVGYGVVFAGVFALWQFGIDQSDAGYGRGVLLLSMIAAPLVAILFGLPMMSAALAILESVANRQPRVTDWPGFNLFDNVGDVIAISSGFFVSVLPGFLLGMWLGGDAPGAGRMQLTGAMVSCFAFFPIVLLSILDTGSIFQPISAPVVRSIKEAAEAWGGYYLKTLVAFFLVMIIWFVLLGKTPVLSAVAGCMLPLLLFFMCQQIGALAESVGEHLSFEFSSPEETTSSDERSKLKDD